MAHLEAQTSVGTMKYLLILAVIVVVVSLSIFFTGPYRKMKAEASEDIVWRIPRPPPACSKAILAYAMQTKPKMWVFRGVALEKLGVLLRGEPVAFGDCTVEVEQ